MINFSVNLSNNNNLLLDDNTIIYDNNVINWLINNNYNLNNQTLIKIELTAATRGDLNVIKWLFENNFVIYDDVLLLASENGNIHILKW